jgi:FKBP-type peptidyl-prolyl cis-trans isomerase FklB
MIATAIALPALAEEPKAPATAAPAAAPTGAPSGVLEDPKAQASYVLGLSYGAKLKRDDVSIDTTALMQGLTDALAGNKPLLTEEQARDALARLQADVQARRQEKAAHATETNKAEGAAFLKSNAAKAGVTTLPSGLQYEIVTAGTGAVPKADDVVLCNYRGTLLDGTEFDSSYREGQPISFPVGGVIRGWTEVLQKMPVGSKWRVYIPSNLAYGEKGAGPDIGPNAVLVFEIELLSIQPKS